MTSTNLLTLMPCGLAPLRLCVFMAPISTQRRGDAERIRPGARRSAFPPRSGRAADCRLFFVMHVGLPNKPAAPNPAIASQLSGGHHRRGVGEPGRSATFARWAWKVTLRLTEGIFLPLIFTDRRW